MPRWLPLAGVCLVLATGLHAESRVIELNPGDSIARAVEQGRVLRHHHTNDIRIVLHGGTYELKEPLVLTPEDSNLSISAFWHDTPVISGGWKIQGWTQCATNPNLVQTELPAVRSGHWMFHSLFVNNERKARTRLPTKGYYEAAQAGDPSKPFDLTLASGLVSTAWTNEPDTEIVIYQAWAQSRNAISQIFPSSNLISLAGKALPNRSETHPRCYVENADIPLRPGQWHLNSRSGLLQYWPDAGECICSNIVIAPHLYDLVEIRGDPARPAHDIAFHGITFADTDWRLDGGSDQDDQAAVERGGAVHAQYAVHCQFDRCVFQRLGSYAVQLGRGCQYDKIIGGEMTDLGAGGVRLGEPNYPGQTNDVCGHHLITDNHIHHIGWVDAPAVGIFILLSDHNEIAHNEVDHTFYTAISVGWSWGYAINPAHDNSVEFNHLHDIGQGRLSDMGGVYTLGVQPGTTVRNNLIHDVSIYKYGGWGLYTDEGSTGITLENNVVYHCQSAGFHQHYGRTNIVRNNIFAFNRDAQLARTRIEKHIAFTFTNNIVYFDSGHLLTGNWGDDLVMDHNIYFDTRATPAENRNYQMIHSWQKRGHDLHSLLIDPDFINPQRFDFRLEPWSPALRFGFKPIDLRHVGVRPKYQRP